jgi:hypothetical protein
VLPKNFSDTSWKSEYNVETWEQLEDFRAEAYERENLVVAPYDLDVPPGHRKDIFRYLKSDVHTPNNSPFSFYYPPEPPSEELKALYEPPTLEVPQPLPSKRKFTKKEKEYILAHYQCFMNMFGTDPKHHMAAKALVHKTVGQKEVHGKKANSETLTSFNYLIKAAEEGMKICHFVQGVTSKAEKDSYWGFLQSQKKNFSHKSKKFWEGYDYSPYRNTYTDAHFVRFFFFDLDNSPYNTPEKIRTRLRQFNLEQFLAMIVETSPWKHHLYMNTELIPIQDRYTQKYSKNFVGNYFFADHARRNPRAILWYEFLFMVINSLLQGDSTVRSFLRLAQTPGFPNPKKGCFSRIVYINPDAQRLSIEEGKKALKPFYDITIPEKPKAPKTPKKTANKKPVEFNPYPKLPAKNKTTFNLKPIPKNYTDYIFTYNLTSEIPLTENITGNRNKALLALSRFIHHFSPSVQDPLTTTFFEKIIWPYFQSKTSKDLDKPNAKIKLQSQFALLTQKTFASPLNQNKEPDLTLVEEQTRKVFLSLPAKDRSDAMLRYIRQILTFAHSFPRTTTKTTTESDILSFFIPAKLLKKQSLSTNYHQKNKILENAGLLFRTPYYLAPPYGETNPATQQQTGKCKQWFLIVPNAPNDLTTPYTTQLGNIRDNNPAPTPVTPLSFLRLPPPEILAPWETTSFNPIAAKYLSGIFYDPFDSNLLPTPQEKQRFIDLRRQRLEQKTLRETQPPSFSYQDLETQLHLLLQADTQRLTPVEDSPIFIASPVEDSPIFIASPVENSRILQPPTHFLIHTPRPESTLVVPYTSQLVDRFGQTMSSSSPTSSFLPSTAASSTLNTFDFDITPHFVCGSHDDSGNDEGIPSLLFLAESMDNPLPIPSTCVFNHNTPQGIIESVLNGLHKHVGHSGGHVGKTKEIETHESFQHRLESLEKRMEKTWGKTLEPVWGKENLLARLHIPTQTTTQNTNPIQNPNPNTNSKESKAHLPPSLTPLLGLSSATSATVSEGDRWWYNKGSPPVPLPKK